MNDPGTPFPTDASGWHGQLGLITVLGSEETGERGLQQVFLLAAQTGSPARFLRLGGPRQFRRDVIGILDETGTTPSHGYRLLLDSRVPEIEFILTNPFSEAFLTRMDAECKPNAEIWRVRQQVLDFARGLLRASERRLERGLGPVKVAFHSAELIWNLGIVEGQYVVVRAYHNAATGHDENVAEIHLSSGSHSRLAESLIAYYNYVRNDSHTRFVEHETDLSSLGSWPSLFKGNAILNPSPLAPNRVEKACSSRSSHESEVTWLSYAGYRRQPRDYFRPVKLVRENERTEPWASQTSVVPRVDGVTAAELLWHLQQAGRRHPELLGKLGVVAGSLIYQAYQALSEFRELKRQVPELELAVAPYPWPVQLSSAIHDAGRFVTERQHELQACLRDVERLGTELQKEATEPFRDAHLKNRFVKLNPTEWQDDYAGLCEWIAGKSEGEIFAWLRAVTVDIDFETCHWLVSKWDDPLHVLWSSNSGIDPLLGLEEDYPFLRTWWEAPQSEDDAEIMWMTLLSRSLREHSRRVWYRHVMPQTYARRYGIERRDNFLKLALHAVDHISGFSGIRVFLDRCRDLTDQFWGAAPDQWCEEPVVAVMPVAAIEQLALAPHARSLPRPGADAAPGAAERAELEEQLREARRNHRLIMERISKYVTEVEVPLTLVREERELKQRIDGLAELVRRA